MSSIAVYSDVIMPESIVLAAAGGANRRKNQRAMNLAGNEAINVGWSRSLRRYELGSMPQSITAWQTIEGLHEVTDGGAYGFLMLDPKDQSVAAAAGLLYPYNTALAGAIGLGYGLPTYKLYQRKTSIGSTRYKDRAITRPQGSPVVKRGGSTVAYGASAGNIAVNNDTGTITFVADSSSTVTNVTVGATTAVTLTAALSGLAIGGRLYLSGLTGADAALLNGLSHAISNITGGGSNVYTLSTNTSGKTITAAGSGYKYPQASETLTWAGPFYVPVHFESDDLDWQLVIAGDPADRMFSGPNVVLIEVRE